MKLCKNCNHQIVKRIWESQGQVFQGYKHKQGGTYCKVSKDFPESYTKCLCHNAEQIEVTND